MDTHEGIEIPIRAGGIWYPDDDLMLIHTPVSHMLSFQILFIDP